jgi:hypothetical protein
MNVAIKEYLSVGVRSVARKAGPVGYSRSSQMRRRNPAEGTADDADLWEV